MLTLGLALMFTLCVTDAIKIDVLFPSVNARVSADTRCEYTLNVTNLLNCSNGKKRFWKEIAWNYNPIISSKTFQLGKISFLFQWNNTCSLFNNVEQKSCVYVCLKNETQVHIYVQCRLIIKLHVKWQMLVQVKIHLWFLFYTTCSTILRVKHLFIKSANIKCLI